VSLEAILWHWIYGISDTATKPNGIGNDRFFPLTHLALMPQLKPVEADEPEPVL